MLLETKTTKPGTVQQNHFSISTYLKLVGLLALFVGALAISKFIQPNQGERAQRQLKGLREENQTFINSINRLRRSLSPVHDGDEFEDNTVAFEGIVIPISPEYQETKSANEVEHEASSSEQSPLMTTLYNHPSATLPAPIEEPLDADALAYQQVATNQVDNRRLVPQQRNQPNSNGGEQNSGVREDDLEVDMSNQVPDSFDSLVKDENLSQIDEVDEKPASDLAAQHSNYQLAPRIGEIQFGHGHVVPIVSGDLNTAAGHYYGKKKHKVYKKKIYIIKKKKKKVIIIKKKKKKYHHHGGGGHHHDHGKYYMYAKVPKKHSWEAGFKKGNKKHWIERHEKGHKNKFKTHVKWYDAKSKGKGHHVWDYNHFDKKKKHYG